ncbi:MULTISPECIES: tRNA pseudouridine(55) synthase TruB [Clostridium]|uniref:tRNA pseudouridine synthase B n=1 Tax=Clostridium cibarium TaxID=2762247 RepID=A0ABR8PQM3_9CLOT|nr:MULTISPECIES: tRNA pseudouridine(55) synthase TruB [Clostridium]MBD7910457.1 tRNA pseudouridine(55) synthase TruB [Clostridium cibarium]
MNGVINVFKNRGMSSFDVVRIIKKASKEKKVGHTGTLDPEATGVLPVCLGKATKIIDYIMTAEKSYYVKFKLGVKTTTYDLEGEVVEEKDSSKLRNEEILDVINSFKGEYLQVPPMYSALKKDGIRLYNLARQGIEVEREGRNINIYDIKNIYISNPYISMDVTCSKGTYIRSLCYDIGEKLGVGATMTELKRTKTSIFTEEESVNIDEIEENNVGEFIITLEEALKSYPKININKGYTKLFINGVKVGDKRSLDLKPKIGQLYRVYDEEKVFIGLGKQDEFGFKIEKLLI